MAAMWRDVLGVETEILNQEWQVFLQTRRTRIDTQVFRYGWIGDYNDPYTFAEILESTHGLNDMGYNNPRYDQLLAQASREADPQCAHGAAGGGRASACWTTCRCCRSTSTSASSMVKPWVAGFESNIMDHHYSRYLRILKH